MLTRVVVASGARRVAPRAAPRQLKRTFISQGLPHMPSGVHKLGKLNHVAIAVPDLEKAVSFYKNILQAEVTDAVPQPDHGVTTVFAKLGNTNIELLHPLGDKSPIANFLKKRTEGGIHHVCLEVADIYASINQLKANGITPLDPKPKTGAHGKPVVFLNPKECNGVLIELEQA